jgi:hypothetical protein
MTDEEKRMDRYRNGQHSRRRVRWHSRSLRRAASCASDAIRAACRDDERRRFPTPDEVTDLDRRFNLYIRDAHGNLVLNPDREPIPSTQPYLDRTPKYRTRLNLDGTADHLPNTYRSRGQSDDGTSQ